MQPGRVVLLDDEDIAALERLAPLRLGGRLEIALASIGLERHRLSPPCVAARRPSLSLRRAARPLSWRAICALGRLRAAPALSRNACMRSDGRFALRRGPLRDRLALELQLDEFGQRALVAIVEGARIERALLGLDDVNGEIEHLAGDLLGRDRRERLARPSAPRSRSSASSRRDPCHTGRMSSVRTRRNSTAWATAAALAARMPSRMSANVSSALRSAGAR